MPFVISAVYAYGILHKESKHSDVEPLKRIGSCLNSHVQIDLKPVVNELKNGWAELHGAGAKEFSNVAQMAKGAEHKIAQLKERMDSLVSATSTIRERFTHLIHSTSEHGPEGKAVDINWDDFSDEFGRLLESVQENLKKQFPPTNQAPTHAQRAKMVAVALSQAEDCFVDLISKFGVPTIEARAFFRSIKPLVQEIVVFVGDIVEQHPVLLTTIIATAVVMIVPENFFLRPLLGLFGFGPYGPVKGSSASWAQSAFFGAAVPKGSWFSLLTRLGMVI